MTLSVLFFTDDLFCYIYIHCNFIKKVIRNVGNDWYLFKPLKVTFIFVLCYHYSPKLFTIQKSYELYNYFLSKKKLLSTLPNYFSLETGYNIPNINTENIILFC